MRALILAGGLGTRIRGLFPECPKPMIPFNGTPFLDHQIRILAEQGLRDFVFCVGYRSTQIEQHFGDGSAWGVQIAYSREPEPLGTGGALRYAADYIDQPVLVLNGDTYLAMDYRAMIAAHAAQPGAMGAIAVAEVADTARYGQVVLNADQRIIEFREKTAAQGQGWVNAGVYLFTPHLLDYVPAGQKVSLEREVFPALLDADEPLYGFPVPEPFIDIGTPAGYERLKGKLGIV